MPSVTEARLYPAPRDQLTFGRLLGRLVMAGVLAGAISGAFSVLITRRTMAPALAIEEARSVGGADTHPVAEELFSRDAQVWGGVLGTVMAAVVFAVLLAVAYAVLRHRLPGATDFARLVLLAAIGFGIFALLPAVKIPANPPAVGDPATVATRTGLYVGVLLTGLMTAILVAALVSFLRSRGTSVAASAIAASATGAVLVTLILVLLPGSPDTIPDDVPADVVWDFRLASLGQLALLWAALGLVGGWLVDRLTNVPRRDTNALT